MPVRSSVKTPDPLRRDDERDRERLLVFRFFDGLRRVWLPDEPDRERVVLRDRGGEDVRVAMGRIYAIATSVSRVTRRTPAAGITTLCNGIDDGW
jgi:hypothetical protein